MVFPTSKTTDSARGIAPVWMRTLARMHRAVKRPALRNLLRSDECIMGLRAWAFDQTAKVQIITEKRHLLYPGWCVSDPLARFARVSPSRGGDYDSPPREGENRRRRQG